MVRKAQDLLEKIRQGDEKNYYTFVTCTLDGAETVAICQWRNGDLSCALAPVLVLVTPKLAARLENELMGKPE